MTLAEFICGNAECVAFGKGFTLNPSRPIGKIDDVIASRQANTDPELVADLKKAKDQGQEYALIQYPNLGEVKQVGWRFHCYCPKDGKIICEEYVDGGSFADALAQTTVFCPLCHDELGPSDTVIEDHEASLPCPHCGVSMSKRLHYIQDKAKPDGRNQGDTMKCSGEGCNHPSHAHKQANQTEDEKAVEQFPQVTARDLIRGNPKEMAKKFNTVFVLRDRRSGQIVELSAASPVHACKILGWSPKRAELIRQKTVDPKTD